MSLIAGAEPRTVSAGLAAVERLHHSLEATAEVLPVFHGNMSEQLDQVTSVQRALNELLPTYPELSPMCEDLTTATNAIADGQSALARHALILASLKCAKFTPSYLAAILEAPSTSTSTGSLHVAELLNRPLRPAGTAPADSAPAGSEAQIELEDSLDEPALHAIIQHADEPILTEAVSRLEQIPDPAMRLRVRQSTLHAAIRGVTATPRSCGLRPVLELIESRHTVDDIVAHQAEFHTLARLGTEQKLPVLLAALAQTVASSPNREEETHALLTAENRAINPHLRLLVSAGKGPQVVPRPA